MGAFPLFDVFGTNWPSVGRIVLRSACVYLAILGALRLVGKRHVAQLSIVDFVLVLLVSNAVQNAMVGSEDASVTGGLAAAFTLLLINQLLTRLLLRNSRAGAILEGEPTLLLRNGEILENHLTRDGVRREELEAAIREHGIEDVSGVKQAILEIDGSISIIAVGEHHEVRLGPLAHHRRTGRRGTRSGG
jgi:uncharacterized membrane protein YcaP (DUF421 family)